MELRVSVGFQPIKDQAINKENNALRQSNKINNNKKIGIKRIFNRSTETAVLTLTSDRNTFKERISQKY